MDFQTPLLTVALALAPGALSWWWGRRLASRINDPLLPEHVAAHRQRVAMAIAVCFAIQLVLLRAHWLWFLAILPIGLVVCGFPARRKLRAESWSLFGYLSFLPRMIVAFAGFWLLLASAPGIVLAATGHCWLVACGLAAGLALWSLYFDRVLLGLLGAQALDRPDLQAAFEAVAARAAMPMPRLLRIGPPGWGWVNALAVRHARRPAVVFTRAFLEAMDPEETSAVFAHELAHLQHYSPRHLLVLSLFQWGLVGMGTFGAAAIAFICPKGVQTLWLIWPAALLLGLVARGVRNKRREEESDRRAAEWCGNSEALVRALVKLHVLGLLPRRWAADTERWSSHPSLAARIRAIRGSAAAATRLNEEVVIAGAHDRCVILAPQRVSWLEGIPAHVAREPLALRDAARTIHSSPYSELTGLRLRVGRRGRAFLEGTSRNGRKWSMPVASEDVSRAQQALDCVDDQIAGLAGARREWGLWSVVVATSVFLIGIATSRWGFSSLIALAAVVLPHPGPLAALGAATLGQALAGWLGWTRAPYAVGDAGSIPTLFAACSTALGLVAVTLACVTRWKEKEGRTRTAPFVALLLALLSALSWAPLLMLAAHGGALAAHQAARASANVWIMPLAAAAAFLIVPRSWARAIALALLCLACGALGVASPLFRSRFVRDPLLSTTAPAKPRLVSAKRLSEWRVPDAIQPAGLRLSPSGRTAWLQAVARDDANGWSDRQEPSSRFIALGTDATAAKLAARDLTLLDDETLLILRDTDDGMALETRVASKDKAWRVLLPALAEAFLLADPGSRRYRVVGWEPERTLVRIEGRAGESTFDVTRWRAEASDMRITRPAVTSGGVALDITADGNAAYGGWWFAWLAMTSNTMLPASTRMTILAQTGPKALLSTRLNVKCFDAPIGRSTVTCLASDAYETHLWEIEPATGRRIHRTTIRGNVLNAVSLVRGVAALTMPEQRLLLLPTADDRVVDLDVMAGVSWVRNLAASDRALAVLAHDTDGDIWARVFSLTAE